MTATWLAESTNQDSSSAHPAASLPLMRQNVTLDTIRRVVGPIKGLITLAQSEWMFLAVQSLPENACIVEIGAYLGRGTVSLALGCVGSKRHVFSIDPFEGCDVHRSNFFGIWHRNVKKAGVLEYVTPLCCESQVAARAWDRSIDLLFIDGSHYYEDVLADWDNFYPHVASGGIIAFHDVAKRFGGPHRVWHQEAKDYLGNIGWVDELAYGKKGNIHGMG